MSENGRFNSFHKKGFNFFLFFMLNMFDFNPKVKIYSVKFFHKNKNEIHKNKKNSQN